MLESIKKPSLLTKILYVIALILFIIWVIPTISSYYTKVSSYEKNLKELNTMAAKQGINVKTQKFSITSFKKDNASLFQKIDITQVDENLYAVNMTIKKEKLEKFYTFLNTISLHYYVEVQNKLEFRSKDKIINIKMKLRAF